MYAVERLGSYISQGVYTVSGPFHPFGGAVDIIVVEQQDGNFKSSPWYVRFGKFQGVLKTREKVVNISLNGVEAGFHMYLNHKGEAYFLREVEDEEKDSMNFDYDSKNFSAFDGIEKSNSKVIGRAGSSRRSKFLRLVFGNKSIDEDVARADSLERAEFAANLLDVNWSTNLSSSHKNLKDNRLSSSALSTLDDNDEEIDESLNTCNGVNKIPGINVGPFDDSMIGKERFEGTSEVKYETDELILEVIEQNLNNSSELFVSRDLIESDEVESSNYVEFLESSALKGDDSINTELLIKETIFEYCEDLESSTLSDSCIQENITEKIPNSVEEVEKSLVEEDDHFPSTSRDEIFDFPNEQFPSEFRNSREFFGDKIWAETANSFEGQFIFSDLDVLENTKEHPLESSFPDCPEKDVKLDRLVHENFSVEPENLIGTTSSPISIPKSNQVDADHLVGSLPGTWPFINNVVEYDFHHSLSRSLDSALKSIDCRELDVDASRGKSDGNEGKNSAEERLNAEEVQVLASPVVDPPEESLDPGGSWRIWPFYFSRSRSREVLQPIYDDVRNSDIVNGSTGRDYVDVDTSPYRHKVDKKMVRSFMPTSDELASLNLMEGRNTIAFTFSTKMLGKQEVDAQIYLWKWNTRIVISDVDGTITKSDVLGQFMPMVGMDWSQTGVAHLFTAIKENGYQLLFLSARAISQAYHTRQFLLNLKQNGKALPEGPVVISPDRLFPSLYREVIRRAPHEFKITCLENIRQLFPADCNPFYAGFGNRDTDEISYLKVGIPLGKIFIINPKGEVTVNRRVDSKSYTSLHDLVHGMFPPIKSTEQEDFNSWNYWKLPTDFLDI